MVAMIDINGSHGEGGGQILRTSISLSALTMKPVRITNIRAGRRNPGLRRQHMAGIELTAQLVNASVKGLEIGSTEIEFVPRTRQSGEFSYDVGTAGSISLILQAVLPPAVLSPEPVSFSLRGGTDVAWSPPIDYIRNLFVDVLYQMGPHVEIIQHRRGHYPRGGGNVSCKIVPVKTIQPLDLVQFGELQNVKGISHCVRLPSHVAERQALSAESILAEHDIETEQIVRESYPKNKDTHLGPGSGIVIWAESCDGIRLGADRLGERGKKAELVGAESAQHLLSELSTEMAIDSHLSDMLVPFLAIATGRSRIGVTKITSHLETNIWVVERILGLKMTLEGKIGSPGILTSEGIGLSSGEG